MFVYYEDGQVQKPARDEVALIDNLLKPDVVAVGMAYTSDHSVTHYRVLVRDGYSHQTMLAHPATRDH